MTTPARVDLPPSDRTRIRRVAENADYQRATVHAIIDAAYVCHVAFVDAQGTHCIPTACWRQGEHLYIHGSNGGRLLKLLVGGAQACVTITHVDGLVLARSAFNHSMNYRSAMIYGRFERVGDETAKRAALEAFMNRLVPGRQGDVRAGSDKEFAATTVMRIALDEAVAKVRTGGPRDDEEDLTLPAWAGVLPLLQTHGAPVPAEGVTAALPDYLQAWQRAA